MKHRIFSIAIFFCLLAGTGYGQRSSCDKCDGKNDTVFVIGPSDADRYIHVFDSLYRTSTEDQQRLSKSIEFSRDAFMEFYHKNFVLDSGKYQGMNVYPVSYDEAARPGQKIVNQLGIILAPRGQDCKLDTSGFICGNNSFDGGLGSTNPGTLKYSGEELVKYCKRYRKEYKNGIMPNNLLYTRIIFLDTRVCDFLATFFVEHPDANGLAIFPASYGEKKDKICGLKRRKQMTIVIRPIVKGQVDPKAFEEYFSKLNEKGRSFLAVNHGSLCPDVCC